MPCRSTYGRYDDPHCAAVYWTAWAYWRAIRRDGRMTPAEVDHRLGVLAELHERRVASSTLAELA